MNVELKKPNYLVYKGGRTFCYLEGEMDKETYEDQCANCSIKDYCVTLQDHYKSVSGDWHSLNAEAFFASQWVNGDGNIRKGLRKKSKIGGLALCYGAEAYRLAQSLGISLEEAQQAINNFFAKLTILSKYMSKAKRSVLDPKKTPDLKGKVFNLFGRVRDVSKDAFSDNRKDVGYAQRTALNHPIQGTASELLKLSMIRVDDFIQKKGLNPLYGQAIPQKIDFSKTTYMDMILSQLSTVHDEIVFAINSMSMEELVPELYTIMQIRDVVEKLGVNFLLELDVEFDKYRSWTSTSSFHTAKIYLLNKLSEWDSKGEQKPNTILLRMDQLTHEKLMEIARYAIDNDLPDAESQDDQGFQHMAIRVDQDTYLHDKKFPLSVVEDLGLIFEHTNIVR